LYKRKALSVVSYYSQVYYGVLQHDPEVSGANVFALLIAENENICLGAA
jgi:hypothetical protein